MKHRFLLCESHNSLSIFVVSSFNDLDIKEAHNKRSVMANSGGTYNGHNKKNITAYVLSKLPRTPNWCALTQYYSV